jgi:trehalose utilization protein
VTSPMRVTVWGENFHEQSEHDRAGMAERYPSGMHGAIATGITEVLGESVAVTVATQDQTEHGLTEDVLDGTDVLTWWGHATHASVDDAVVDRVHQRVLGGMGLLVLHSAHFSKIFRRLMGTTCSLAWRNSGDTELVWSVNPAHPITAGIPQPIVINEHEMYGEFFDIPAPDELIFISTFSSGEVFRSGCCWRLARARCSTSHPVIRSIRSTITRRSGGCWPMECCGPGPSTVPASLRLRSSTSRRLTSTELA